MTSVRIKFLCLLVTVIFSPGISRGEDTFAALSSAGSEKNISVFQPRTLSVFGTDVSAAAVKIWETLAAKSADSGAAGTPAEDIFLLLAIDHLLKEGTGGDAMDSPARVRELLEAWVLAEPLPDNGNISEDEIIDFYYENQNLFMESAGRGTMLIADLKRFPDAEKDVNGRLAQGEPLKNIAGDFSLPEEDMKKLMAREEVQSMLWQCRGEAPDGDTLFFRSGDCVLWYEMKFTRSFLPLDDKLKRQVKILLKTKKMGGWERIFGIDPGFSAAARKGEI